MTMSNSHFVAKLFGSVTAGLVAASLSGCEALADTLEAKDTAFGGASGGEYIAGDAAKALAQLEDIPVRGRASKSGYSREEFGPAWADTDQNGCDTRNDILARDLTDETFKPGSNKCVVTTGTLADKYTRASISFVRGQDTSTDVQIDHIVPLSDAWQKGAQQLSAERRKELANDPLNLMAAVKSTNSAKGDKDAATWLPPNLAFRCEYVARQTAVKAKYDLWVTRAEHDTITGILKVCD
jgi:hypothetical protein